VPVLVGLGVDELSLNPAEIPRVKSMIRKINPARAARLAEAALNCASASDVRNLIAGRS